MSVRSKFTLTLIAIASLTMTGCGGSSDTPTSQQANLPAVGPISGEEFAKVAPPTFQQFMTAYEAVTTNNPGLLNDETALAKAIFSEIKRTTPTGSDERAAALSAVKLSLWDKAQKLTVEEWKLVIVSPLNGYNASTTVDLSAQTAVAKMPCDSDIDFTNGKADAVRHAYWNALMAKRTTISFAQSFGTAHESGGTNTPSASAMDLHNNAIGRSLVEKYPTATEAELLELILQQTFTLVPSGTPIPANLTGLVYITATAQRPFDGTFTGTLTNPDSGGAWNAVFNVSQCGSVVRGNLTITRGSELQERRFTGTTTDTSHLSLSISDPYVFENPRGLRYCSAMQSNLSGNLKMLSGNWTSFNCRLGGEISISRP